MSKRVATVLSVDGGGARGVIPSTVIARLEEHLGQQAWQIFDVMTGTSTGAVLSLLASKDRNVGDGPFTGKQLVNLYTHDAKDFFQRTGTSYLPGIKYLSPQFTAKGVEQTLLKFMGNAELRNAMTEVIVSSYDLRKDWPRVVFFSRRWARGEADGQGGPQYNFLIRDVGRGCTAAPGYFPGARIESLGTDPETGQKKVYYPVDGGVYINNPAMEGLVHVLHNLKSGDYDHVVVVALGTGKSNDQIVPDKAKDWGLVQWVEPLINVMFEGQAEAVSNQLEEMASEVEMFTHFYRFQPAIDPLPDLSDTSPATIERMQKSIDDYLDGNTEDGKGKEQFDHLVEVLQGRPPNPPPGPPSEPAA